MVDRVEIAGQISFDHPSTSGSIRLIRQLYTQRSNSMMDAPLRSEAVGQRMEIALPNRFHGHEHCALEDAIPTLFDRAMLALHLLALEPVSETTADKNSYGFRPKRGAADAIEQCFICLSKKTSAQWILEGDIKACFDEIDHQWLMEHICTDKRLLHQWLAAGYIEEGSFHDTEAGSPQESIVSSALANMVLDALEAVIKDVVAKTDEVHFVRYADDFIVTGISRDVLETKVQPAIVAFLTERGLSLSTEKTHITHIDDGFYFLGFNVRRYSGKLLIKPSRKSVKTFLDGIRALIKSHPTIKTVSLIRLLNPKLRGWANYYRHVVSKQIFSRVNKAIFQAIYRWSRRRHPNKGAGWVFNKYYKHPAPNNWWFHAKTRTVDGHADMIRLIQVSSTKIVRHVKVIATATPAIQPIPRTSRSANVCAAHPCMRVYGILFNTLDCWVM